MELGLEQTASGVFFGSGLEKWEKFQAFLWLYGKNYIQDIDSGDLPVFQQEWTKYTQERRLAIAAPRSFGKSTFFSVLYPLFCVLEGEARDVLLISAAANLAEWWLGKIRRELEGNKGLLQAFGEQQSHIWRQEHLELKNGAVIRARGSECKIRGFRPDLVIVDDLESEETVWSEINRKKLSDWFWKSLINTMNPQAQLIMIGTILHPESLLAHLQAKPPLGWEVKTYKALNDDGESLWPSRWTTHYLKERRDEIGTAAFEQEYQNNPVPEAWRTFKEEHFQYYDQEPKGCTYVTTVDPAIQVDEHRDPDYTAIVTCAYDVDKNMYIVEYVRKRLLPNETIDEIFRHFEMYEPNVIGIETIGFQKMLKFALDEEASRRELFPYFKEINTGGSGRRPKKVRIERLQPYFERRRIFMKEHMSELKTELLSFPTGKHDDLIDALASQIEFMQKGMQEKKKLPPDCFEAWWIDHKRQQRFHRLGEQSWGNHKLRRSL